MPRLIFAPCPGSDILDLVRKAETWANARRYVKAIQLGVMEHIGTSRANQNINGPNYYEALVEVGFFRKFAEWGIPISLGAPGVKPWSCDGVDALRHTCEALDRVRKAGNKTVCVQVDEPLQSAIRCGLSLEQCAAHMSRWIDGVRAHDRSVLVGLYAAYPNTPAWEIIHFYERLQQMGSSPSFLTLDVDRYGIRDQKLKPERVAADLAKLRFQCAAWGIPCGLAIFGQRAKTEAEYVERPNDNGVPASAWKWFEAQRSTDWSYVSVESWEEAPDGTRTLPMNLPESDSSKHAALLKRIGEAWHSQSMTALRGHTEHFV